VTKNPDPPNPPETQKRKRRRKDGLLSLEIATRLSPMDKYDRELMWRESNLEPLTDAELAYMPVTIDEYVDRVLTRRRAKRTRHARGPSTASIPKWGRPACGAKTRQGTPCKAKALWDKENNRPRNGRCRIHGGLSTGPKTPEGKAKSLSKLKNYKGGV
jgi:hypothetical protein